MLEEVLSYLRLLILLGFLDVRGGKNETSCDEKTNDTVFRILLFVLESVWFHFGSGESSVWFLFYPQRWPISHENLSSLSPSIILWYSVLSSSLLYKAFELWHGQDLAQHWQCGLFDIPYPARTDPFDCFSFSISKSIAQIVNFAILFLLQQRPKMIFLKKNKNWLYLTPLTLVSPFQLCYPLF